MRVDRLCHAVAVDHGPVMPLHFNCRGTPSRYQHGSLWLRADLRALPIDRDDLVLMVHQTRFDRLVVSFAYADGVVERQQVASGRFGTHWRAGGQIAFEAPVRDAPLVALTMRFDRLTSHDLLRLRLESRGAAASQSAMLAALIGIALTLLLIGAIYNFSLAITTRHRFLAWHGAWAACVLIWGVIWSELDLVVLPGVAGTVSAQSCTLLACLAITLATASATAFLEETALPRMVVWATLSLGVAIGLVGIPASLVRGAAIGWLGALLSVLVLADLAAVAGCLLWAWRRGSREARDLAAAWSVPMAALAVTQATDVGTALWGGGSQIIVLFAAAWQTVWLSASVTRKLARLRFERDRAQAAEAIALELADRDALTGLSNRRGFLARVEHLIAMAQREGAPVALMLIDIDRFKSVNDAHGHYAGDRVLCTIAERMRRWAVANCTVARLGGEEFALFITGVDGFALMRFAESVRQAIEACDHHGAIGDHVVTASIGLAEMQAGDSFDPLYKAADDALYAAKRSGRNRVVRYREAVLAPAARPRSDRRVQNEHR